MLPFLSLLLVQVLYLNYVFADPPTDPDCRFNVYVKDRPDQLVHMIDDLRGPLVASSMLQPVIYSRTKGTFRIDHQGHLRNQGEIWCWAVSPSDALICSSFVNDGDPNFATLVGPDVWQLGCDGVLSLAPGRHGGSREFVACPTGRGADEWKLHLDSGATPAAGACRRVTLMANACYCGRPDVRQQEQEQEQKQKQSTTTTWPLVSFTPITLSTLTSRAEEQQQQQVTETVRATVTLGLRATS